MAAPQLAFWQVGDEWSDRYHPIICLGSGEQSQEYEKKIKFD